MTLLPGVIAALILASCATIGTPEGGPRDLTPPVVVRTNPPEGATNVTGRRITVTLNKNIQLDDAFNKVVVSPAQITAPQITSNGKTVTIQLRDTLIPHTTYTIDLADAVKDLNEGNLLDGFATDFSTGDTVDSLRISGMVLEARTLEPAQGMLVGVHSNLSDTALTSIPFERITKTNSKGVFTVRNLRPGSYRIFALNDINRDYRWDRSEDVAFYDTLIVPTAERVTYADTLRTEDGRDSVVDRSFTRFRPNDILLTWFNEEYRAQYLKEYKRETRRTIRLELGAPTDSLPRVTIAGPDSIAGLDLLKASVLQRSATNDTLVYYIRDPRIYSTDSLRASVEVLRPDSTGRMVWMADTLRLTYTEPRKTKAQLKKEEEARKKAEEDSIARGDSIPAPLPPTEFIKFSVEGSSTQELNKPLYFKADEPIDTIIAGAVKLYTKKDTLWVPVDAPVIERVDSGNPLRFMARYTWTPATAYKLTVDSAAITGMYGLHTDAISHEFTTRALSDYGTITFKVTGDTLPQMVELLNSSGDPVRTAPVKEGKAVFDYLDAGTYYARLFVDADSSGTYTTGSLSDSIHRQPEETYYFPKKLELKKNWDIDQPWNIYALPIDIQKPFAILKNKPKDAVDPEAGKEDEEENPLPPGVYLPE